MTPFGRFALVLALLAALLVGAPASAQKDKGKDDQKDSDTRLADRIKTLEKLVEELTKNLDLEVAKRQSDQEQTEKLLRKLVNALADERKERQFDKSTNDDTSRDLNSRLARIESALDRLNTQTDNGRRAFSIDPNPRTRSGTIVIENYLAEEATVWIDGTSYRVAPLSRRRLTDQPSGAIQYAARRSRSSEWGQTTRSSVRAGETLTIDVYER